MCGGCPEHTPQLVHIRLGKSLSSCITGGTKLKHTGGVLTFYLEELKKVPHQVVTAFLCVTSTQSKHSQNNNLILKPEIFE